MFDLLFIALVAVIFYAFVLVLAPKQGKCEKCPHRLDLEDQLVEAQTRADRYYKIAFKAVISRDHIQKRYETLQAAIVEDAVLDATEFEFTEDEDDTTKQDRPR